ncbi:hypothetical protein ACFSM5_13920 [Lacibacterium aquatile]|uniref:Glycosyltransferase n=1 Tax=Lacibacterium aquatile TaxID=1168082 RepID=A0ABW5DU68_9PROT
MRVFVGPIEVAGYYRSITEALRLSGLDARLTLFRKSPFAYAGQEEPGDLIPRLLSWGRTPTRNALAFLAKTAVKLLDRPLRWLYLPIAAARYDAFLFGFSQSITNDALGLDLWLLKKLGKRLVFVFNGSDTRPPWMIGMPSAPETAKEIARYPRRTLRKRRRLRVIERYADAILCNPLTAQLHKAPIVNHYAIGAPFAPPRDRIIPDSAARAQASGEVIALHSPSRPLIKGTPLIERAVAELRDEGIDLRLVKITGKPHSEVLDALCACDFVIDQAYSDTPLAGFATEAAAFGKIAVVSGYELEECVAAIPPEMRPPSAICTPETLKDAIRLLATDAQERNRLNSAAQQFIAQKWSLREIGGRMRRLLEGDIPPAWILDPMQLPYRWGAGIDRAALTERTRRIVAAHGLAALGLDDKPALQQRFATLVAEEN